jgi:Cytochrome P450
VRRHFIRLALNDFYSQALPIPCSVNVKKRIPEDMVLAGYRIPKGATVLFSQMAIKNDPAYAGEDPHLFNPDRYSEEAVKARKGTRAEVLDHPLCSKPFGFGARMCVGSRVAKLECKKKRYIRNLFHGRVFLTPFLLLFQICHSSPVFSKITDWSTTSRQANLLFV